MAPDWRRFVASWLLSLCFIIYGCGYPEVSSTTYELSQALYSACNRRSDEQLLKVFEVMNSKRSAGEISDREFEWLRAIIEQARAGEWGDAQAEVRNLMNDQVKH